MLIVEKSSHGDRPRVPSAVAAAVASLDRDPFHGARLRHVIGDDAEPSDMEAEAGRRAMRAAGLRPDQIDLVIVSSLVPDRLLPSNAPAIQLKCELARAAGWNLELGCASFQAHLVTAAALIQSGMYNHILIVASSAVSRILDYADPTSIVLGDGAAAAVVGQLPHDFGVLGQWMRTDGSYRDGIVHAPIIDGKPQRRWENAAGLIRVTSLNPDLTKEAGRRAGEFCREACVGALENAGLTLDDVALYVGSQSSGWFVDACGRSLGLGPERTVNTFPEIANIGAATVIYNLDRAAREGRLKDGDVVLLYSPGAGLTRAAVVYRWRHTARSSAS